MILKDKQFKTVKVTGAKEYVEVKERIKYLVNEFEGDYSIQTEHWYFESRKMWVVKATLTLIQGGITCVYCGHAQEIESENTKAVNFSSALENAETSAVGRACAMAGIGIETGIASADEIKKAQARNPASNVQQHPATPQQEAPKNAVTSMPAAASVASFEQEVDAFKKEISNTLPASEMVTAEQIEFATKLLKSHVFTEAEKANYAKGFKAFTKTFASHRIDEIKRTLDERKAAEKAADQNGAEVTQPAPLPITVSLKTQILLLLNSPAVTKEEKEKMVAKINTLTQEQGEKSLAKLKAAIADRTTPAQSAA